MVPSAGTVPRGREPEILVTYEDGRVTEVPGRGDEVSERGEGTEGTLEPDTNRTRNVGS